MPFPTPPEPSQPEADKMANLREMIEAASKARQEHLWDKAESHPPTLESLLRRIQILEKELRQLWTEQRPTYIPQPYPVYPQPYFQPIYPPHPYSPHHPPGTILC